MSPELHTSVSCANIASRPAEAVASWLDTTLDALHEKLGWGGAFVVGGPGLDGEPVHYM